MNGEGLSLRQEIPLEEIIRGFAIYGEPEKAEPFGSGHINSTFRSVWNQAGVKPRYIHQRINDKVFARPDKVMENIERVTNHLREAARRAGCADISRSTLTVIPARDGRPWVRDRDGGWWRTYLFIEGSRTLELASSTDDARFLGESIARFQSRLAGFGAPRLYETIPDFHNMEYRYRRFYEAVSRDSRGRVKDAEDEIAFMKENEKRGAVLNRSLRSGAIPERICHNDAKINNILVDENDFHALCVIDLDTVMPGTSLFDLGDLIRSVCTTAAEDERDLSKVEFDLAYFEALLDGYLSGAPEMLTSAERALLCESGRNLSQIMGLRFLTDYLEGDCYYRTARAGHNLDRCRNQIALIKSMDSKWKEAEAVAAGLRGGRI